MATKLLFYSGLDSAKVKSLTVNTSFHHHQTHLVLISVVEIVSDSCISLLTLLLNLPGPPFLIYPLVNLFSQLASLLYSIKKAGSKVLFILYLRQNVI